jgi:hypothetical protein
MTTTWLFWPTTKGPVGVEEAAASAEARRMARVNEAGFIARVLRRIGICNTCAEEKFLRTSRGSRFELVRRSFALTGTAEAAVAT